MAIEIPGIDVKSGLDLCDGNTNIYINSLRIFASKIPEDLEKMKGVSRETLGDYSVTAHSVKSMSVYIGAEESRQTAKQLEAMADAGDYDGILAQNEKFIKYVQGLVDSVRNWLIENNHSLA